MKTPATEWILRSAAVAIAIAALIDPSLTSMRSSRPEVVVQARDAQRDSALSVRVRQTLAKRFAPLSSPLAGAAATVIVGGAPTADGREISSPVFIVEPSRNGAQVTLTDLRVPASVPAVTRASVSATAHATGARGKTIEATLEIDGVVVDVSQHTVASVNEIVPLTLSFTPWRAAPARVRVIARLAGTSTTDAVDALVDAREQRWAVLFFDPRPSWMSTFTRRALESDPRFDVTSRVVTSRNVSTDVGRPPRLEDATALANFDAIVVGAPGALDQRSAAALDRYLRRRGGSVVLLMDEASDSAGPAAQLAGVQHWSIAGNRERVVLAESNDSSGLRGAQMMWPSALPPAAVVHGASSDSSGATHPIVWSRPVGGGRLVVSGALDAWRYRDRSPFERYWQTLIADAASWAPAPLLLRTSAAVASPAERVRIDLRVRDRVLAADSLGASRTNGTESIAGVNVSLDDSTGRRIPLRVWPVGEIGALAGELTAPTSPGTYTLVATVNGQRASTPLLVARDVAHPAAELPDLLHPWTQAHAGAVLNAADLGQLPDLIARAIHPPARRVTWHPMRSAWWMVPFALLLAGEWWQRRKRGFA